jgi:hypothetical protein
MISILFHHYRELTKLMAEVKQIEVRVEKEEER